MPEINVIEFKQLMKKVTVTESSFKVVFPWGFRVVEFGGGKVLQPLTPEEYILAAAEDPGKKLTDLEIAGRPRCECKFTNTVPVSHKCTEAGGGWCSYHCSEGRWYSICNYL